MRNMENKTTPSQNTLCDITRKPCGAEVTLLIARGDHSSRVQLLVFSKGPTLACLTEDEL